MTDWLVGLTYACPALTDICSWGRAFSGRVGSGATKVSTIELCGSQAVDSRRPSWAAVQYHSLFDRFTISSVQ